MKHSLATILLAAIEGAKNPVSTTFLVEIAAAEGYKHAREQTWGNLMRLQENGYIRQHRKGKGTKPTLWVPTISGIPARGSGNAVAGGKEKGSI